MNDEPSDFPPSAKWLGRIGIVLTLLLIATNFFWIDHFGLNIPFMDDHGRIYRFMMDLEAKDSTSEQLHQLLRHQTNEHRIVTSHFTYLGMRTVTGEINLKWLMYASGALLVFTYFVFYQSLPIKDPRKPLYLFPVALLMFIPMHQSSNWGLQYCIYICYANVFFSLFLLAKSRERFWLFPIALISAVLATYSFGSGMFVFVAGLVLCVLPSISWVRLLLWLTVGAASIGTYFAGLELPDNRIPLTENLVNNYPRITGFYFAFLASGLKNLFVDILPQLGFGVFLAGLSIVLMWRSRKQLKAEPLILAYVVYLIVLLGPTAISRSANGIDSANSIRFQLTSTVVLVGFYLLFWATSETWMKRSFGVVLTLCVLIFAARLSNGLKDCESHASKLKSDLLLHELGETPKKLRSSLLNEATRVGMYDSPADSLFPSSPAEPCKLPSDLLPVQGRNQIVQDGNGWVHFRGFAVIRNEAAKPTQKWLIFTNNENDRFRTWMHIQPNNQAINAFKNLKAHPSHEVAGYEWIGKKDDLGLPPGRYDLGVLIRNEDGKRGFRDLKIQLQVGEPEGSAPEGADSNAASTPHAQTHTFHATRSSEIDRDVSSSVSQPAHSLDL